MTLRELFLLVVASVAFAIVALWFSLHVAKGVAKVQQDRVEAVEKWAAQEDGQ